MRKTKIVCTMGPATDDLNVIKDLIEGGMDVARINFSHQDHSMHQYRIELVREAAGELRKRVGILADTRGPEIRIGDFKEEKVYLEKDQEFTFTTQKIEGDASVVSVSYQGLPKDVSPGNLILVDDGAITLQITAITSTEVTTKVINGGPLTRNKGVHLPGTRVNLPAMSEQDKEDISFALKMDVDFIAASFIRKRDDVMEIRRFIEQNNGEVKIISKIETKEAVSRLSTILDVSDGVMVARGDLGVELQVSEVPLVQKYIIDSCNRVGKPVITATQMLESMINNARPTRAEASDVANAIFDGTDAVMLSGETAVGKYPIETITMMRQICEKSEQGYKYKKRLRAYDYQVEKNVTDSISSSTCHTAEELGVAAIITSTHSGHTARMVSKYRPKAPIVAVTPFQKTAGALMLTWGVIPQVSPTIDSIDDMFDVSIQTALDSGWVKMGDLVVITAGVPVGVPGATNLLRVESIGDIIGKGMGLGSHAVIAKACCIGEGHKEFERFQDGQILVAQSPDQSYLPLMERAAGIIVEEGGLSSFTAVVSLNLGLPVIVGVEDAVKKIPDGELITLDSLRGLIYKGRVKIN